MTQAQVGQCRVGAVITVSLGISVLAFLLTSTFGNGSLLGQLLRLGVIAVLCHQLYFGSECVRRVLGMLLIGAGLMVVYYGLQLLPYLIGATMMFVFAFFYLWCAGLLFFSQDIKAFQMYQRRGLPLHRELESLPQRSGA